MKTFTVLLTTTLSLAAAFGQDISVKSQQLDRLIWTKINVRLMNLGKQPIAYFEDSLIYRFAARASNRMIQEGAPAEHSSIDSLSYWTTGYECIFRKTSKSSPANSNRYIQAIQSGNLDMLAQLVVDAWESSPSHNEAISRDTYPASTVATAIVYNPNEGKFKLTATWISMWDTKFWKPKSGYTWIF